MEQVTVLALNTTTDYFRRDSDRSIQSHLIAASQSMYQRCAVSLELL